ncbi:hypothetical protein BCR42DRAFT_454370 [Absidia repens]|uniref:Uncharacterized protein n=1 Tax=Absidia repens TaxID=90262 RepID=A0A1X2I8S1_9FUNG|nr:hypothetical protein BCR42DRAFT_454370 [Absidia repens]
MTNKKHQEKQNPDIDDTKPAKDILSLVLEFIGLGRNNSRDDESSHSVYSSSSTLSTKVVSSPSSPSKTAAPAVEIESSCIDTDQSTLYSTEGVMSTSSTPPKHTIINDTVEESTVLVQPIVSDKPSLSTTWAFQEWLQRLPKLALFHLISTTAMQDPIIAYHLLEYQYMEDINDRSTAATTIVSDMHDPFENLRCDNTTKTLVQEVSWIQTHSRAIIHQLDHLRPNEQFAKAKDIADQLISLTRLCGQQFHGQWGDSWTTIMALVLMTYECLDNSLPEIRQYLFYRAKFGRTIVLEMNAALKNFKVYRGKKLNHWGNNDSNNAKYHQVDDHTSTNSNSKWTMTPQQYMATYFFSQQRGLTSCRQQTSPDISGTAAPGWICALETICSQLERLDDGWKFRDEYQQVAILASNITLD